MNAEWYILEREPLKGVSEERYKNVAIQLNPAHVAMVGC